MDAKERELVEALDLDVVFTDRGWQIVSKSRGVTLQTVKHDWLPRRSGDVFQPVVVPPVVPPRAAAAAAGAGAIARSSPVRHVEGEEPEDEEDDDQDDQDEDEEEERMVPRRRTAGIAHDPHLCSCV